MNYNIDIDFGKTYGKDFDFLQTAQPASVFMAKGSKISVKNKRKIKPTHILGEAYN